MLRSTFVLALASLLPAQIIQLPAVADATTDSSQPAVNFGTNVELNFGKAGTTLFLRGYIQFDLSSVQSLGMPQRARLMWYQSRSTAAGCLDVSLHRLTAAWSESTVTWSTQPSHDAVVISRTCVGDSFSLGWKSFDATALVQGWLNATWPNFGMVIKDPIEITAGASRPGYGHSRESAVALRQPYLELDYGSSFGAGCATVGTAPVAAFTSGMPRPGSSFLIRTTNLVASSLPVAVLGTSNTMWATTPLPFSLAAFGFAGCNLLVSPDAIASFPLVTQTTFDLNLSVPNNPLLVGLRVFAQNAAFGPAGSFHLSNGVAVTIL